MTATQDRLITIAEFWVHEDGAAPPILCGDLAAQMQVDPGAGYAALAQLDRVQIMLQAVCYADHVGRLSGLSIPPALVLTQWEAPASPVPGRGFIYAIENAAAPGVYVGKSTTPTWARWDSHRRRLRDGIHHCERLQGAWNTYGESAFVFKVLQVYDGESALAEAETATIRRLCAAGANVYNTVR